MSDKDFSLKLPNLLTKFIKKQARSQAMEINQETDKEKIPPVPAELPLLPLKDTVVYPLTVYPLVIGKEKSIKLINDVTVGDKILGLTAQKKIDIEVTGLTDMYSIGTMARILQMVKVPDGTLRVLSSGHRANQYIGTFTDRTVYQSPRPGITGQIGKIRGARGAHARRV